MIDWKSGFIPISVDRFGTEQQHGTASEECDSEGDGSQGQRAGTAQNRRLDALAGAGGFRESQDQLPASHHSPGGKLPNDFALPTTAKPTPPPIPCPVDLPEPSAVPTVADLALATIAEAGGGKSTDQL